MSDLRDLDRLISASRRARGEHPLVTPCCGATPFLRDGQLRCPGVPYDDCARSYSALAELVVDRRTA